MEEKLLSKKDLAKKWGVTTATIDRWIQDKVITPAKGIPSIRFTPQHIAELEGVKIDRFSPLERKRLEKEKEELQCKIDSLQSENTELKEYVKSIVGNGVRFINVG
jgi:DNA-directed RNA polymerase specialized sigma54-like protein